MADATVVSCPGKVFIAGGYLVLDPKYSGMVVGTASRFYTVVRNSPVDFKTLDQSPTITVNSPQFKEATWVYRLSQEGQQDSVELRQAEESVNSNKFVQITVEAAVKVSTALGYPLQNSLDITIVGDNDFYSQDRTTSASFEPEPFAFLDTTIADVHKTGLGSSAAMVTSLSAAILTHLSAHTRTTLSQPDLWTLKLMHNVAQYAHSFAQGKVGSGFDVSVAVFGSQIYKRFEPKCLTSLLENSKILPSQLYDGLSPDAPLWSPSSPTSGSVKPFALPPLTSLVLADVDAGSNTPSMVGKVLKWQKELPEEANTLWEGIAGVNSGLAETFQALFSAYEANPSVYAQTVSSLEKQTSDKWVSDDQASVRGLFCKTRDLIEKIRRGMKVMGAAASVPIEPDEQTRLIDTCTLQCEGVVGGGVPGAGGYDAIWLLILSPASSGAADSEDKINRLWRDWTEMSVRPLSRKARIQGSTTRSTSETSGDGLRLHKIAEIKGLQRVVQ